MPSSALTRRSFVAGSGLLAAGLGLAACGGGAAGGSSQGSEGSSSAASDADMPQTSFFAFDTGCSVGGDLSDEQMATMQERCEHFENIFSRTIATSDIGRINADTTGVVKIEEETAELIATAFDYCERSKGLFDITIGAVSELWDFHEGIVPDAEALREAIQHVNWQFIEVSTAASMVTLKDPLARIDLGGIAKGYVADALLDELKRSGVQSAFVNLGGNVAVLGPKPNGEPWVIGVRNPDSASEQTTIASVESTSGSLVTSGLYERQFEKDGERYWHILDPRTGYPVRSGITSVSVYSEHSIDGDGLTKPVFFMEPEEGLGWLEDAGVQGLIVTDAGDILTTAGSDFVIG